MADDDALRHARGSRCVNDISGVSRIEPIFGIGCVALRYERPFKIDLNRLRTMRRQTIEQGRARDQQRRVGVFDHEVETVLWIIWIERQVSGARLQAREDGDDHLD